MKIRLKKRGIVGIKKIGLDGRLEKVDAEEGVKVFVRGLDGLGLIIFSDKEAENLINKIKKVKTAEKKAKKKLSKNLYN